jgi:hypothetical protein
VSSNSLRAHVDEDSEAFDFHNLLGDFVNTWRAQWHISASQPRDEPDINLRQASRDDLLWMYVLGPANAASAALATLHFRNTTDLLRSTKPFRGCITQKYWHDFRRFSCTREAER